MTKIQREITPLVKEDLFLLLNNKKAKFDYAIHFHSDIELNLVLNTSGKRIVGDSVEMFQAEDLVLIGSNIPHVWKAYTDDDTQVITIQFQESLLDNEVFSKRIFKQIREMIGLASKGIVFSGETLQQAKKRIFALSQSHGFNTALEFLALLNELAISPEQRFLTSVPYDNSSLMRESKSHRIGKICTYIDENYHKEISLGEIANLVDMSESAVSHFFKKRTNRSFITYLNEVRIGNAARMLVETNKTISEISYACGFSNISNFNRMFKRFKDQTPTEYRNGVQNIITKY